MANYCYNHLVITGDKDTLDILEAKFEAYMTHKTFSQFGNSFFEKAKVDENIDYGTRWWDFSIERDSETLTIQGDSAWSPPEELVQRISEHYKVRAELEYSEPGCDFAGERHYESGEVVHQYDGTYADYKYHSGGVEEFMMEYMDDEEVLREYESFEGFMSEFSEVKFEPDDIMSIRKRWVEVMGEDITQEVITENFKTVIQDLKNLSMNRLAGRIEVIETYFKQHIFDSTSK